jgi:hypothetical protein
MANYAGLPTRGPQALITSCVLTAITCGIIGLRMFTRLHLVKCFGLEDYLTVVSGVSQLNKQIHVHGQWLTHTQVLRRVPHCLYWH